MRLYMVEDVDNPSATFFYWADSEGEALDEHEVQGADPEREWVASAVFANNADKRYRGYVVMGN